MFMTRKEIGKMIQKELSTRKWSVYKLSKETGVKITPLQSMITGTKNYTIESYLSVFNVFGWNRPTT